MRAFEFLAEQSLTELNFPNARDDAGERLEAAGYVNIGQGVNASVFNKADSPYAIKLFDNADEAYVDFVKLTMRNSNPHFPKFKGKLWKITENYYAIRMEKLQVHPTDRNLYSSILPSGNYNKSEIVSALETMLYGGRFYSDFFEVARNLQKMQPKLEDAVNLIKQLNQHVWDLHSGNIMFRGNDLVIIDPVA